MTSRKPANIQVKTVTGNWTEDGGHHAVTSWLKLSTSKSAGFGAVVSQNDAMAIGARRAFGEIRDPAERETWLGMPFLGCDGLPETGQQYVHGKLLVATIVTPPVAGIGLETFMHWRSEGKAIPERLLVNPISFPATESLRPQSLAQKA
jgi:ribose transport system substrate-binding protein